MRRLAIVLGVMLLFALLPADAGKKDDHLDWHLDASIGINDDSNLESRIDWHVEDFYVEAQARQTDYGTPTIGFSQMIGPRPIPVNPFIDYEADLQWRAQVWYRAFPNHGPYVNYVRITDVDKTWGVGWYFHIGSD